MTEPPSPDAQKACPRPGRAPERKALRKEKFLEALFLGHSVVQAGLLAGVSRRALYDWRRADKIFAGLWDLATGEGTAADVDPVEREALRRAVMGVKKPVFRGGEQVATITEHSDSLLMFLLKARNPQKYGGAAKPADAPKSDFDLEGARDALLSKFSALNPGVEPG